MVEQIAARITGTRIKKMAYSGKTVPSDSRAPAILKSLPVSRFVLSRTASLKSTNGNRRADRLLPLVKERLPARNPRPRSLNQ